MAKPSATRSSGPRPASSAPQVVDPRWLLRTLGFLIALALVCGYLTLGLLFYLGSWQLALKPTHDAGKGSGLPSEHVLFKSGGDAVHGEWLRSPQGSVRGSYAALYLRGADGQLDVGDGTQIDVLHDAGLNVLAFDYRGYGPNPANPHPTEKRMLQDADAAWEYLVGKRGVAPDHVLIFGSGVGVSLGAQLLQKEHAGTALIGYNADADVLARARRDPRSHLFPLALVFRERFPLDNLKTLRQPKLLYSTGSIDTARTTAYRTAADPRMTVEMPTHSEAEEKDALARFLDEYAPSSPSPLQ